MIPLQKDIRVTVFGGRADKHVERSAYDSRPLGGNELYAALPYRFKHPPLIRVHNRKTDKWAVVRVRDVGPWNTRDDYFAHGRRPQAESGRDKFGRRTNKAGIDLSPAAAEAIGVTGDPKVDLVDWEEVNTEHGDVS